MWSVDEGDVSGDEGDVIHGWDMNDRDVGGARVDVGWGCKRCGVETEKMCGGIEGDVGEDVGEGTDVGVGGWR
jgi:hypothetical protein